jgi:hypothetical protein
MDRWWMRRRKAFLLLGLIGLPVFGLGFFNLMHLALQNWSMLAALAFGASAFSVFLAVAALLDGQGKQIHDLERGQSTRPR